MKFLTNLLRLLLGYKIFSLSLMLFSPPIVFLFSPEFSISSVFYLLACTFADDAQQKKGLVLLILFFVLLLLLMWMIFYLIFLLSKKKKTAVRFFIIANLLDACCMYFSFKNSYHEEKIFSILFSLLISGLLFVWLKCSQEKMLEK